MKKVILFYKFTSLNDPEAVRLWQKNLATSNGLKGRIIIADHGINGTLSGELKSLKNYIKETKLYPSFKDVVFKWSTSDEEVFPKLSVKVRSEIVTFGVADKIKVNENGIEGGGKHLSPEKLHKLMEERGSEVVFFDGRNAYEAEIGKFKNAVVPNVRHTRDFPKELESSKYDDIKSKPVVTYCTGGIRCEVLSALMKQNGFEEVYQMDGGIVKYGEKYGDDGFWEGSLYVFDGRMNTKFSDKAEDIGICSRCALKTSNFENCSVKSCNDLILICTDCYNDSAYCETHSLATSR
jgi:UPF0176 protein